jgi:hypothetical protein
VRAIAAKLAAAESDVAKSESDAHKAARAAAAAERAAKEARLESSSLRARLAEVEAAAAAAAAATESEAAVSGMEAALGRMAALLKKRDGELEATKRIVQAECDERARLLALVEQLQAGGARAQPHTVVPLAALNKLPSSNGQSLRGSERKPTDATHQPWPPRMAAHPGIAGADRRVVGRGGAGRGRGR